MTRPILVDTSVLIWVLTDASQLTGRVTSALRSSGAEVRISVVSAWEIAIKAQSGKLSFDVPIEDVISRILSATIWPILPVLPIHISELLQLPLLHRDPFDRLLIAQARAEGMLLATSDAKIQKYKVATIT